MKKPANFLHVHRMGSYLFFFFFFIFNLFSGDQEMVMGSQNISTAPDEFKVGVVLDMDKVETKMLMTSISMALSDFYAGPNSSHKRKLVLHIRDSNNGVVDAASAAIDLMKNVEVQAIIGPLTSSQAVFMVDLGNKVQVPIISFTATSPSISPDQNPYFIRATQKDSSEVNAIASIVKAFEWREAIPIYEDTEYGNGIIPSLVDALQDMNTQVPYRSVIPPSATDYRVLQELYKLMTMQTRVFILHMTPPLGLQVLQKAEIIGMMSKGYAWIITDGLGHCLNSFNSHILNSMQGVLAVRPYIPMSNELDTFSVRWKDKFLRENPDTENAELDIFGMWAYDIMWALASSVENLKTLNSPFLKPKVVQNSSDIAMLGVSQVGPKLIQELSKVKFRGVSGEFHLADRELQSSNIYQILNVVAGKRKEIGIWTPSHGIVHDISVAGANPDTYWTSNKVKLRPIVWPGNSTVVPKGWVIPTYEKNKKLRILVPVKDKDGIAAKFVNVTRNSHTNSLEVKGFCIDVFKALAENLPYSINPYEFIPFANDDGSRAGNYNDLIDQVYYQNYDAVVGDVTITANRSLFVDFTVPYLESGVSMIVPLRRDSRKDAWIFLKPLKTELWLTSAAFFLVTGVVIWFLEHRLNDEFRGPREHQLGTMFSFSFSTLVFAQRERVNSNLARFVVIIWIFIVLVLTSAYTANLASMLTVGRLEPIVTGNLHELVKNGDNIGCKKSSFFRDLLKQKGFHESNMKPYTPTREDFAKSFSKVRKNDAVVAILDEVPYNRLLLSSKDCEKYTMIRPVDKLAGFGFVFPRGSRLAQDFSREIINLIQNDRINEIEKFWFGDIQTCPVQCTTVTSNTLSLDSFWVLFLIGGLSLISAVIIFSIDFLKKNGDILRRDNPAYTSIWQRVVALGSRFNEKDLTFHKFNQETDAGNRSMELIGVTMLH